MVNPWRTVVLPAMMRNQPVHSSSAIYCSPHGPTIHPSTKREEQAEVVVEEEEESSEKMETEGLSWEKEEKEKSDEVGVRDRVGNDRCCIEDMQASYPHTEPVENLNVAQ